MSQGPQRYYHHPPRVCRFAQYLGVVNHIHLGTRVDGMVIAGGIFQKETSPRYQVPVYWGVPVGTSKYLVGPGKY